MKALMKLVAAVAVTCSVALLASASLSLAAFGEEAGAAFSGKNGRIAFSAFTPKRGPSPDEIFTTNPDGTGERQRTPTTPRAFNSSPSYSPDGRKLVFDVFGATGQGSIQTKKADGTKRRTIFAPRRFRPSLSSPPTARRAWRTMPRIPIRHMRCGARKK